MFKVDILTGQAACIGYTVQIRVGASAWILVIESNNCHSPPLIVIHTCLVKDGTCAKDR